MRMDINHQKAVLLLLLLLFCTTGALNRLKIEIARMYEIRLECLINFPCTNVALMDTALAIGSVIYQVCNQSAWWHQLC